VKPLVFSSKPIAAARETYEASAARFRRKADECQSRAKAATDPETVTAWLELASMWNGLTESDPRRRRDTQH
jgi:hypothetical protein